MDHRMLSVGLCLLLAVVVSESAQDVTTFANIIYKRALPHGKGFTQEACLDICLEKAGCWGVNFIGGMQYQRGECQLLLTGIATCDPTSHRKMPPHLNAVAMWVDRSCPLQRKIFGENSPFRLDDGKSLDGNDVDPCPGSIVHWRVHDNVHVVNGAYIRGPQTFLQCLDSCALHVGCAAVDFDFDYGACFHFGVPEVDSPTYVLEEHDCCAHARIQCDRVSTTPAPTTTPSTTTAAPITTTYSATTTTRGPYTPRVTTGGTTSDRPYTRPTSPTPESTSSRGVTARPPRAMTSDIPDTGCPGQFLKYPFSGRQGGSPMLDLPSNTSEACKQYCLDLGDQCTGIDFDVDVSVCYTFSDPDPQGLPRGDRPCCDHYVKLDCEALSTRQCYQHGPLLFLANPNEHNVIVSAMPPLAPPDLVLVPCEGVCYQNLDHDADFGFFSLVRGCNTSAGSGRSWRACTTSDDPFVFDKNCSCEFDRCNGVNTFLFDHLTCHYSFDDHTNDLSGFNRDGRPFNVSFDPATAVRSYSAHFDGKSSFIHFPAWHLVHAEEIGPDGTPLLSFTIAMWVLRPQTATGSMTVLSTYGRDLSTIQIVSELDLANPWNPMQTIKASIIVNHTMYEVQAPAPLNEWFFLAFTLDGYRSPPLLALDINDLENIEPEASLELTNVTTSLDELTITNRGLFLGKQAQIIEELDEPFFFEGYIDDFFCYDKALSYHELLALRDLSLPLP